jgi:hypothetical protein
MNVTSQIACCGIIVEMLKVCSLKDNLVDLHHMNELSFLADML